MTEKDFVLTQLDIELIRAALRFWIDEMPQDELSSTAPYFDEARDAEAIVSGRPSQLLDLLGQCQVRFALPTLGGPATLGDELLKRDSDASHLRRADQRIATVLLHD